MFVHSLSRALLARAVLVQMMDITGLRAHLHTLLVQARAHIFPQGWLDLAELRPYRATSYTFWIAAKAMIRGVLAGWSRQARRASALRPLAVRRFTPSRQLVDCTDDSDNA